ncbi:MULTISPECIES: 3-hydroxyacyl-CoA dehydrogenase family protein [Pseudomonas]|uniref:3-hydroxybutyryl-CoA dehydrogenase n=1 Tax=Pseudomonas chlororaphis TaxID=587753 RepID=A0AAQ1FNM6_9PSED|nr:MULTISPECIES: 3-hydroxyacyl-CoA dehydrogenase NAD-binding domain-containing protein [Pseudomonas]AZC28859.1 3-hydroxybutyryl-CoA dehydrogenase [Pseudomonas chlororaphis subsp. piscium]AZC35264.1 3-hydroxybutyryl-CoA dehydrogenase [Pseudomonas chlororaphis subsp. piscium]AZC41805.1 3-hydroxybutyryl-CoA dehydrogenase [Pseudomonas chlororaphis subsp. piscium]WDG73767.1 3-hydroxyacyl-CoA dehydrogenase NAD-binding domain-containing protein [Pseudomonas chlororaphis]WDG92862.1 3-hydroxyacyl-CoA d
MKEIKVAVIGSGTMGKGIVQILAQSNIIHSLVWLGRSESGCCSALDDLNSQWERMINKKRLLREDAQSYSAKISVAGSFEEISNCDLVLEAITEDMTAKHEVFREIAKHANAQSVIATNTSSLSITELASITKNPENVVGLHFFNPAPVMKLVEVIVGLSTSNETATWAFNFAKELSKEPVLVNEAPGFIVNRMLIPMINEAIGILAEGVASPEEIDKAMKLGANHPIGPLALADLIGNDVNLSIMETLHNETGDPKYRAHPLLRKMVRANRLGRKTGIGFYNY